MPARDRESFVNGGASGAQKKTTRRKSSKQLSGAIKPSDLRDYDGPLFCKNLTNTIISHDDGKTYIKIEPAHSGLNVVALPLEVATHPDFQRLWRRGKVEVSADPDMEESLYFSDARFEEIERERQASLGAGAEMEANPASKDLSKEACLRCGDEFFMPQGEKDSRPPLCDVHKPLEANYVPAQKLENGKVVTKWSSATMTDAKNKDSL